MTSSQPHGNLRKVSPGWHPRKTRDGKYLCPNCSNEFFTTIEEYSRHVMFAHQSELSSDEQRYISRGKCEPFEANASEGEHSGKGKRSGDYVPHVCHSPRSNGTPNSSDSESAHSTHNNFEEKSSSPVTRTVDSAGATTTERIRDLSLENRHSYSNWRGRGILSAGAATSSKRAASSELQRPTSRRPPVGAGYRPSQAGALRHHRTPQRSQRKGNFNANHQDTGHFSSRADTTDSQTWSHRRQSHSYQHRGGGPGPPLPRDSGYETLPSRATTLQPVSKDNPKDDEYVSVEPLSHASQSKSKGEPQQFVGGVSLVRSKVRWPGLILQPESSPISQDQLAAEVKGIYGGLVMVEAKCINIDAAQAADPSSTLGPEQWQALIALHRTLLYEHHDFLMATQHPSATPALRGLAQKYSMPARMWRHGIHAFLEVLRYRRPHSQDYMVSFVYLAYQMMALLFETVPSFTDTWIECLGDLARYRMAIEEDREIHAIWGGVAASWYNTASDRHPSIGRLYHHLGILERPGIRKLFLYSKSLTCVIPFPNARDSLGTLCSPFVRDGETGNTGMRPAETRLMKFHAFDFMTPEDSRITELASDAISAFDQTPTAELRDTGVYVVVSNIAALFERGSPNNAIWQLYGDAINADIQSARPSTAASELHLPGTTEPDVSTATVGTSASEPVYDFYWSFFNALFVLGSDPQGNKDLRRALHAALVWLQSLELLRSKLKNDHDRHTLSPLLERFPWGGLCNMLNVLCQRESISPEILLYARQGVFPGSDSNYLRAILEDYLLRGLIWTQWYHPTNFFDGQGSDEQAQLESSDSDVERLRVDRIQYLALCQAFRGEFLKFDAETAEFWAVSSHRSPVLMADTTTSTHMEEVQLEATKASQPSSPTTTSPQSDSDGYLLVEKPKSKATKTWANVASKSGRRTQGESNIHIVDDEEMRWAG